MSHLRLRRTPHFPGISRNCISSMSTYLLTLVPVSGPGLVRGGTIRGDRADPAYNVCGQNPCLGPAVARRCNRMPENSVAGARLSSPRALRWSRVTRIARPTGCAYGAGSRRIRASAMDSSCSDSHPGRGARLKSVGMTVRPARRSTARRGARATEPGGISRSTPVHPQPPLATGCHISTPRPASATSRRGDAGTALDPQRRRESVDESRVAVGQTAAARRDEATGRHVRGFADARVAVELPGPQRWRRDKGPVIAHRHDHP